MQEYEKIYDLENLYAAYLKARRGKRWKDAAVKFEINLLEALLLLKRQLITTAVRANINHVFTNGAKQQGVTYWKVILKIVVMRNDTEGDIKLGGVKCVLDAKVE